MGDKDLERITFARMYEHLPNAITGDPAAVSDVADPNTAAENESAGGLQRVRGRRRHPTSR